MPTKKTAPKTQPKPDLTIEYEGAPPALFLLRDGPASRWLTKDRGLAEDFMQAGTFKPEEAAELVAASHGNLSMTVLAAACRNEIAKANPTVLAALAAFGGR